MAVQPEDAVEQLGTKAVHHRHDDDERCDAQRDRAGGNAGDEKDEALAATGE